MNRELWSWKSYPDGVFENLQYTRVEIKLEDSDRQIAIALIEDVLKGIVDFDEKLYVLFLISCAIQKELFKSKEIDVETIEKLAAFYPRCVEVDDDPRDDMSWVSKYDHFKLSPDEEEEDDGDEDISDVDTADEDEDEEKVVADEGDDHLKKREAARKAMMKFEEAGMNELKRQSNIMGCSLKQGKEQEIFSAMLSFFADKGFVFHFEDEMERAVKRFMSRVKGYISSTCKLEDLRTVRTALDVAKKRIKADVDQFRQQLEMNTVPTNEEGIATPVKRLKQENRDCGIECENAIPFKMTEQEEICLTPPEFEGMKTEECEIATCMNQPDKEKEKRSMLISASRHCVKI